MAVTVAAYGLPTWALGRLMVVIVSGAGLTVIDRLREATKGPGGVDPTPAKRKFKIV